MIALASRLALANSTFPLHFVSSSTASLLVNPLEVICRIAESGNPPLSVEDLSPLLAELMGKQNKFSEIMIVWERAYRLHVVVYRLHVVMYRLHVVMVRHKINKYSHNL